MISPVKVLVTATAVSEGGRNGHSETTDKSVAVDLSVPKAMGGPGRAGTTTPEHLFATGYAACFGGALDFVASSKAKNAKGAVVTCAVGVGPRDAGGFGITAKLTIADPSIPQAELEEMVHETHEKICPYSHATRGNVDVTFEVVGA
jgi:Ohr subfamily peroxiredoxin